MRTKEENRAYMREWKELHPNYCSQYMLQWRESHPFYFADYYQNHKEQSAIHCRLYRQQHPDRIREYRRQPMVLEKNRKYRHDNRDKLRAGDEARAAKRRALIMGCDGSFSNEEWAQRLEEFNSCCAYCCQPLGNNAVREHMTPLCRGGDNTINNIIPSCPDCNSRKGTKTLIEFVSHLNGDYKKY